MPNNNYNYYIFDTSNNTKEPLQITSDDVIVEGETLSTVLSNNKISINNVTGANTYVNYSNETVGIKWTDPDDISYEGLALSSWSGTIIVKSETAFPSTKDDGTIILNCKVKNQYSEEYFVDDDTEGGHTYYYTIFAYNTAGSYSNGTNVSAAIKERAVLTVDKNEIKLSPSKLTDTVTYTTNGDGLVTITTDDTNQQYIQYSQDNNTISFTATGNDGTAHFTITQDHGTNYAAPNPITVTVSYQAISSILAENSPDIIKQAITEGKHTTLWSVGDKIPITLNGTLTSYFSFNNETYYAVILGFDHNKSLESNNKNSIHFVIGKNSNNIDIFFCDSKYTERCANCFNFNSSKTNSGGWEDSYMRRTVCTKFLTLLPNTWQNAINSILKYTDNTGGTNASYRYSITATSDKIWLMSNYEISGSNEPYLSCNDREKSYQQQYQYYQNGNSFVRYKYNNTAENGAWWTRSPYYLSFLAKGGKLGSPNDNPDGGSFSTIMRTGSTIYGIYHFSDGYGADQSFGFVPCFAIVAN